VFDDEVTVVFTLSHLIKPDLLAVEIGILHVGVHETGDIGPRSPTEEHRRVVGGRAAKTVTRVGFERGSIDRKSLP